MSLARTPCVYLAASALVAALVSLVLAPPAARADAYHFQGIPLGQRAIGFGGAFTGIADDPSGAYYNPAGLAWAPDSALSATFTLNAFDRQTIDEGYRTPLGDSTLRHDSDPSLPVSGGFLKRLGKRDESGERKHALSLSTFTIDDRRLNFDIEIRDVPPTGIATLSVDRSTRTHWQGLTYAYRASRALSFGISGFLSLTKTSYRDELISVGLGGVIAGTGAFTAENGVWSSHRVRTDVKNLVLRAGIMYEVNPRLRLGAMLQPPGIHMRGRAYVRERMLDLNVDEGGGQFFNAQRNNVSSHYPIPWEIRLGLSYRALTWLTLSGDASLYGRDGSAQNPVVFVGNRKPDAETGAVPAVGAFENERGYRRMSGNAAVGAEARIGSMANLRAGLFTSMSSAPAVPATSAVYYAPDIHRLGAALSVGVTTNGFDVSLGAAGLFGRGDGMAFDTSVDDGRPYRRTEVSDATLFVFITGMRSAVAHLVKTAEERLRALRGVETSAQ